MLHSCRDITCIVTNFLQAWTMWSYLCEEWLRIRFQLHGLQSKSSCKGSALYMAPLWYLKVCFGYCEPVSPCKPAQPLECVLIFHTEAAELEETWNNCCKNVGFPEHDWGETRSMVVNVVRWTKQWYHFVKLCSQGKGWNRGDVSLWWKFLQIESRWSHKQINTQPKYIL